MKHNSALIALAAVAAALFVPAPFVTAAAPNPAPAFKAGSFDPPRQAPDFHLRSSAGQELTMSQYRGKVVLLAFGYTSCTEVCPTTLNTFAVAHRKLGPMATGMQVIYITVDPGRDVPTRLAKYLSSFDSSFIGGTGTEAQLAAVRKDYGVSAEKKVIGDDYTYAHSSFAYLIDRKGRIRGLMPYGHSPDDYVNDLTLLLQE